MSGLGALWDWTAFWTAVAAIGTVGSLCFLILQLRQLRRDRRDDYLRALIPSLSLDLYDDRRDLTWIPLRVNAHGGGVAYAVTINLNAPQVVVGPIECGVIPFVREDKTMEVTLPGGLIVHQMSRFVGSIAVGFTDGFGKRHDALQPISSASGPIKITDRLHWHCKACRVHPTDPRESRLRALLNRPLLRT